MIATLPFVDRALVEQNKIVDYLLNPAKSRGKAEFFLGFGFSVDAWQVMAKALVEHGKSGIVSSVVESEYGTRYSIDGTLETPAGRRPRMRTVWIVENGTDCPRLITAYPL